MPARLEAATEEAPVAEDVVAREHALSSGAADSGEDVAEEQSDPASGGVVLEGDGDFLMEEVSASRLDIELCERGRSRTRGERGVQQFQ